VDQATYDKIWSDVQAETRNRNVGSFKRALWYGNNSMLLGQNKGLRKALRNAPKTVTMGAVGAGLGALEVVTGVSDMIEAAVDTVLKKGKDVYSSSVKQHIKSNAPMSAEESMRKNVKKEVKRLKEDTIAIIDRNLVKLKDAKKKVTPKIQAMMASQSHMSYAQVSSSLAVETEESQMKKAHDALRAVAETEYYIDKVMYLVGIARAALKQVELNLDSLKGATLKTQNDLEGYIKEML